MSKYKRLYQGISDFLYAIIDFLPNSRALLPTFHTICPDGVFINQDRVSFCPESYTTTPILYSAITHSFQEYLRR